MTPHEDVDALRESEARFRDTFEQAAIGIAHVSIDGRFLLVNDMLCAIVGYDRADLLAMSFEDLTVPEDRSDGIEAREAMLAGTQSSYTAEKRYRKKNGDVMWTNLVTTLAKNTGDGPKYFISVFEDITRRKVAEARLHRLNRLHGVMSKAGEAIVRARDRHELYETICRILVEDGSLRMAFIGEVDAETGRVFPVASGGAGLDYLREMMITTDGGIFSQGVVGTVLRTGQPQFCNDVVHDPLMAPWRERAALHGFQSLAAFPLTLGKQTVGALALYAGELGYFQDDEIQLMVTIADSVSFAIEAQIKEQERQRVELALRASEANLAAAQRIAHFGSWQLGLGGSGRVDAQPLRWSDEMYRIAGYKPGAVEVTNELFFSLVPPEEHESIRQAVGTAIRDRQPYSIIHRLIRADGVERVLHEAGEPIFDQQTGEPVTLMGTAHDITAQRQADRALQESEGRYRALVDWSPDAVAVSRRGTLLFLNRAALKMMGAASESDLIGTSLLDRVHPDFRAVVLERMRTFAEPHAVVPMLEQKLVTLDGRVIDAEVQGVSIVYDGEWATFSSLRDVTERKRAEQDLRESDEKFRLLADHITDVFWIRSPDMRHLHYLSPAFERIWGRSVESLRANPHQWSDFTVPEDRERARDAFAGLTRDVPSIDLEYRIVRPDGDVRWVRARGFQVRDANGVLVRLTGIASDVTERKRVDAQLLQSQKMETVGTLAGGIAHEFNSILTAIIGQSELLLGDLPPNSPLAVNATEIGLAAGRAATLTRQLLAYGGRQMLRPEAIDLNQVLVRLDAMLCHAMGEAVDVRLVLAPDLPAMKADAGQIDQVITNIAINARAAMPGGGTLTFETGAVSLDAAYVRDHPGAQPGDYVSLAITDTGAGISDELQARLFEPFVTTRDIGQGSGLGLSICYGIVKQSGGHITVESESGQGTTFRVYLPKFAEPVAAAVAASIDVLDLPRGIETILMVESDPALRDMAAALLRRLGYSVLTAANAVDALGQEQDRSAGRINLLFTEVVMPNVSGAELAERLRMRHPQMRTLFTSAYTEAVIIRQSGLTPGAALLRKPFSPSALARKLREVLDAR